HGPARVLERVDRLVQRLPHAPLATVVYAVYDPRHRRLLVANAGHPPPLLVPPGGDAEYLAGRSPLLGVSPEALSRARPGPPQRRSERRVTLLTGSHLLLYTDGLIDAAERAGEDGLGRLRAAVQGFTGSAADLCQRALTTLAPAPARDDICVVAATVA
ncbi:MAG TPA: PP2C family protein-serine/threonine phosphatase, partial [Acidimicrobiales bacterium]